MSLLNKNKINLLFLFLPLIMLNCKKEKSRICEIYSAPNEYAIGTITDYVSLPTKVTYSYNYYVDGIKYTGKERAYGIGQTNSRMVGRSYVVVYKEPSPGESDLNTDYKIESQADFQQYENEFQHNPPEPDWPKCK